MDYKLRKSESVTNQLKVENLQDGVILRLNIIETIGEDNITYEYDEFWFSLDSNLNYIETILDNENFSKLSDEYKKLIN